jgi:hypothetical protein
MTTEEPADATEELIENSIAALYRGFFQLRDSKQYRREYDTMGTLMSMLQQDRDYLRRTYPDAIES